MMSMNFDRIAPDEFKKRYAGMVPEKMMNWLYCYNMGSAFLKDTTMFNLLFKGFSAYREDDDRTIPDELLMVAQEVLNDKR